MGGLIELREVTKTFGPIRALDNVSLTVQPGITGLLGPNGAGKSTMIKVLMGLVKVNRGSGTVMGNDLRKQGRAIRSNIGYMPEDDCYIPGMTGIEVVTFSACLAGLPELEGLRRSHEILDFCGMGQERYRNIEAYSTGMRQKIKFASSIVHDPDLLILDEPTSGLDPEERVSLLQRVRVLATKFNKSVIISTHILPDVQLICDHVIIINRGQISLADRLENVNRSSEPKVHVRIEGDPQTFIEHMSGAGFSLDSNSDGSYSVEGNSIEELTEIIWSGALKDQYNLASMSPVHISLDEIILNTFRESSVANS